MKDVFETNFTRNLSAICLIAAPLLLLTGSLLRLISPEHIYQQYILSKAGIALFIFAIFALVQMLRKESEKLAVISGGMAIIGAISGATLTSFVYYYKELQAVGLDAAALQATNTFFGEIYMTMVFAPLPGLFFPIGLLILSIGLFIKQVIPRPIAIILAVAAITFPMGRIPQNGLMFVITDSLFLISMSYIAWQICSSALVKQRSLEYARA